MSRVQRFAVALVAVVLLAGSAIPAFAAGPQVRPADAAAPGGRLVVFWRAQAPIRMAMPHVAATRAGAIPQRSVVIAARGHAGDVAAALRTDPRVLAVVPDARVHALDWPVDAPPNDPLYPRQTDLPQVHVPQAWPTTTGDPGMVVAVIDSGVDLDSPDLVGVPVVAPRNETFNNTDVSDPVGHGTMVAGEIFARTNNDAGIAGIAPNATLMPIKVLDGDGSGFFSDVLDAVDWARTHGADVINLSLGDALTPEQAALFQPTFTAARAAGILVVAAAGNTASAAMVYPAGLRGVVSVSAVDASDNAAVFSTFNRAVDLSAPGVSILSTSAFDPSGYEVDSGTSFSAPIVAGIAALVWTARPTLTVDQLEAVLRASATDLGTPGRDNVYGSGRVNAEAALTQPVPDPLPDLEPAPLPTGPMEVTFTSPVAPVRQTSLTFTVSWVTSHDPADGILFRLAWLAPRGRCPGFSSRLAFYDVFAAVSPTRDTTLKPGYCYRYVVDVVDEANNVGEAISAPVTIIDRTPPRVIGRSPGAGATAIGPGASIRVHFSEPVVGVGLQSVRLRNLSTGRWVLARVGYSAGRQQAILDPVRFMIPGNVYVVYVTSDIRDHSGNRLAPSHWTFRVRP